MTGPYVRRLTADDLPTALPIVAHGMLGSLDPAVMEAWAELVDPELAHGAFTPGGEAVGIVRWFRDEVSVPGGSLPAAGVTAVAVLSNHRRQGHLTRLMHAQLADIADQGIPIATLIAAEWPIYGRFGYGPAADACRFQVDARTARFRDAPSGALELVTAAQMRPHLEEVHRRRWARSAASLRRIDGRSWDHAARTVRFPGDKSDPGLARFAIWRDAAGEVRGALVYEVSEAWTNNRPAGQAQTKLLFGETPEAERELWRHLCDLDWVTTVRGELRPVDDPLPLFLLDARAAVQVDRSDFIWARILDVPAAFAARRSAIEGEAVVEVVDPLGYAEGRWAIELGPDGGCAKLTVEDAGVRMPAGALGATFFGGYTPRRLSDAGWLDELRPGAVDRLGSLLATPVAPHGTTDY